MAGQRGEERLASVLADGYEAAASAGVAAFDALYLLKVHKECRVAAEEAVLCKLVFKRSQRTWVEDGLVFHM